MIADVALAVLVAAAAPASARAQGQWDPAAAASSVLEPSLFGGLSTISFAFVCHHSSFFVHQSLGQDQVDSYC